MIAKQISQKALICKQVEITSVLRIKNGKKKKKKSHWAAKIYQTPESHCQFRNVQEHYENKQEKYGT